MKIVVSSFLGKIYDSEATLIEVNEIKGSFGIMENHVPIMAVILDGYLHVVNKDVSTYILIKDGVFEFHDNLASVLVQEAYVADSYEAAKASFTNEKKNRLERNRQAEADYTKIERDLAESIKESKAGSL